LSLDNSNTGKLEHLGGKKLLASLVERTAFSAILIVLLNVCKVLLKLPGINQITILNAKFFI